MIPYLGDFVEDDVVYMMFNTFTSDDPSASCTITNLSNTDVHIHKDDGLTQRNNAAGITVSVDFDGVTGSHLLKIDTNDNTVAAFWVTGSDYFVRVEGTTIDGATINAVVGHFSIENRFMRGTDSAATAAALTTHDGKLDTADTAVDGIQTDLSNATDGLGALKALIDANQTDLTNIESKIDTADTVVDGIQTDLSNATDGLGALKALIDTVDGVADAILDDTGTTGVVVAAASKTDYALSAAGIDSILDEVVEGALTHRQILRLLLASIGAKVSGGGTATIVFRDVGDTKDRITATVDLNGNRTAMTVDGA